MFVSSNHGASARIAGVAVARQPGGEQADPQGEVGRDLTLRRLEARHVCLARSRRVSARSPTALSSEPARATSRAVSGPARCWSSSRARTLPATQAAAHHAASSTRATTSSTRPGSRARPVSSIRARVRLGSRDDLRRLDVGRAQPRLQGVAALRVGQALRGGQDLLGALLRLVEPVRRHRSACSRAHAASSSNASSAANTGTSSITVSSPTAAGTPAVPWKRSRMLPTDPHRGVARDGCVADSRPRRRERDRRGERANRGRPRSQLWASRTRDRRERPRRDRLRPRFARRGSRRARRS